VADSAAIPLIGRATELDRVRAAIERASSAAGSTLSEVELCRGTYDPDRQRRCSPARRVPGVASRHRLQTARDSRVAR